MFWEKPVGLLSANRFFRELFFTITGTHFPTFLFNTTGNKINGDIVFDNVAFSAFHLDNRLIISGFKRPLQDNDLWSLDERNQANHNVPRLHKEWEKEFKKCRR